MKITNVLAGLVLSVILASGVSAAPVTWYLHDATFDDGGIATGSFSYDAETNTFSDIDIVTSLNPDLGLGAAYHLPTGVGFNTIADFITGFPPLGEMRLVLQLTEPMTDLGGVIALNITREVFSGELICSTPPCGLVAEPFRWLVSGYLVSESEIPLPAAMPLFLAGLAAGAFFNRRRRVNA